MYCAFSSPVKIQSAFFFFMCQPCCSERKAWVSLNVQEQAQWWAAPGGAAAALGSASGHLRAFPCGWTCAWLGLSPWVWGMCCLPCPGNLAWDTFTNDWVMVELHREGRAEGKVCSQAKGVKLARVWVCSRLAVDETFFKHDNCKFCHNFPLTKL